MFYSPLPPYIAAVSDLDFEGAARPQRLKPAKGPPGNSLAVHTIEYIQVGSPPNLHRSTDD